MRFSFQYLFHFIDKLFQWNCTIDFKLILLDFAISFAIFTMWLQTYEWTNGQTYGQNDGQTVKTMGGQANEWMDMQYKGIDGQKTMIFQQIMQFLQKH